MLVENQELKEINDDDIVVLENNPDLFWKKIKSISSLVFKYNYDLKNLNIPETVEYINPNFLVDCFCLKNLTINGGLRNVRNNFVEHYKDLEFVHLGKSIETIGSLAFYNCRSLKKIVFPSNLEEIGAKAFYGCELLEKIRIPRKISIIKKDTFRNCTSLKKVSTSLMLKKVEDSAFYGCSELEELVFKNRLESIGENAFTNCNKLSQIVFKNIDINVERNAFNRCPLYYFVLTPKNNVVLSKEEIVDIDGTYKCYDLRMFNRCFDGFEIEKMFAKKLDYEELNRLAKKLDKIKISIPFDFAVEILKKENSKKINLKYYKQLYRYFENESYENIFIFCKLARGLGLFEMKTIETRISKNGNAIISNVDYAQKAGEFLKLLLEKQIISVSSMNYNFRLMKNDGFKREYALFMMNRGNFEKLMKFNLDNKDFISKIYNYFEKVQLTNSNDKGSHKYLAPTVEKFISYFKENKFKDIDDEVALSNEIGRFYDNQELFEYAKGIKKEYKRKKIPANILSVNLEEKSLLNINNYRENILKVGKNVLNELANLANNNFTFEWLRKDDVINFTLGKYCNCCAHLADTGDGIVKASVIHPDVQNLILRDKQGTIVAKSTLYINREQCYGVFNNVEISHIVPESAKKQIYDKYKLAIKTFAEVYNKENPTKPLKQINVGMQFNDLYEEIKYYDRIGIPLPSLHYYKYSRNSTFNGNSEENQHIVWENKGALKK